VLTTSVQSVVSASRRGRPVGPRRDVKPARRHNPARTRLATVKNNREFNLRRFRFPGVRPTVHPRTRQTAVARRARVTGPSGRQAGDAMCKWHSALCHRHRVRAYSPGCPVPGSGLSSSQSTHSGSGVGGMLPRIDASKPGCPPVRLDHFGSPRLARDRRTRTQCATYRRSSVWNSGVPNQCSLRSDSALSTSAGEEPSRFAISHSP
jgi:hypothetical protein